jgi:N-ethylmaleimide reductase
MNLGAGGPHLPSEDFFGSEFRMPEKPTLFSSYRLGPLELKNRIVMAPMTRNRAGKLNEPTELNARYYEQRASAGLIVTEASQISPQGLGYPGTPGIYSAQQVAGWNLVTEAVHRRGGKIFLQLWHVGRISHPSLQPDGALPVAPSAIKPAGQAFTFTGLLDFVTPRALETKEIAGIVNDFAHGARCAKAAGFDGVEIHAANGYLIDQFLRDGSNHRTDEYGGSLENRVRFLREVTQAVTGVWGPERVGVRFSPVSDFNDMRDSDPHATFSRAAEVMNELKVGYMHVVETLNSPAQNKGRVTPAIRLKFRGAVIANGGYDLAKGNEILSHGEADLVSYGVLFLANPDLPVRFEKGGQKLNQPDQKSFYGGGEKGYTDYPVLQG